jgi:hypothetical protein
MTEDVKTHEKVRKQRTGWSLCDARAEEYSTLSDLAGDEQLEAVHTLPWTMTAFTQTTVYCDAIYC